MTDLIDINQMTIGEWRQLGFYYDLVENASIKEWRLFGSKKGLLNFVEILNTYTNKASNDSISEHEHIGPYNYLKVMTWNKPIITEQYFAGTISDIKTLATLITEKLNNTLEGESCRVDSDYGTDNTAAVKLFIIADNFDPASMDDLINNKGCT